MNARIAVIFGLLTLALQAFAFAYPRPLEGTESISTMMRAAALVCRGEVLSAPAPTFVTDSRPRSITAVARVQLVRCYKGDPGVAEVGVLFDSILSCCGPSFVLKQGDYRLFFLKPNGPHYDLVDQWFGALTASKLLAARVEAADSAYQLELDLKAGLRDSDEERVLDSIRMLGNMGHLRANDELAAMARSSDAIRQTYAWQALLRLADLSNLPAVTEFLLARPAAPHELLLPRDRLFYMQTQLTMAVGGIKDPTARPFLARLASATDPRVRSEALQGLRGIESPHNASIFLGELEDHTNDNDFSAMQGLLALAGPGSRSWVPSWEDFRRDPAFYAAQCRQWWESEGRFEMAKHPRQN